MDTTMPEEMEPLVEIIGVDAVRSILISWHRIPELRSEASRLIEMVHVASRDRELDVERDMKQQEDQLMRVASPDIVALIKVRVYLWFV